MPRINHIEYGFQSEPKGLTLPLYKQVHGNRIIEVTKSNLDSLYRMPQEADGALTYLTATALSVFTADCLPLLFYTDDPTGPIATIHCGWRGALHNIAKTIPEHCSIYSNQLNVILGPCLGPCCFEVKQDFIETFHGQGIDIHRYLIPRGDKLFFHLSEFVINEQLGFIDSTRINKTELRCTYCSMPELPSFRRNKSTNPRIRGWISKLH